MPADVAREAAAPAAGGVRSAEARSLANLAAQLRAAAHGRTRDAGTASSPSPDWLRAMRTAGIAALDHQQLPDERTEAWRHTALPALADTSLLLPVPATAGNGAAVPEGWAAEVAAALSCPVVVIVDGHATLPAGAAAFALGTGAAVAPPALGGLAPLTDPFVAMNAALLHDVLVIDVAANTRAGPLLLQHRTSETLHAQAATRVLVRLGHHAELTLIEDIAPRGGLHNLVTEVVLEDSACLRHWRASSGQSASAPGAVAGTSIARTFVDVSANATYQGYQQVEAGHRVREELHIALTGEGAQARLAGVAHLQGRDHGDIALRIEHLASSTTSSSLYRGIAGGRGHFVFKGQIHIPAGVRAIDAALTNKNLLLSNDAEIDTRPELTINADDVRCSHGATIGQLDADALFLLRARGIDAELARSLIMRAFAVAALHALPDDAVRELLTARLRGILGTPA